MRSRRGFTLLGTRVWRSGNWVTIASSHIPLITKFAAEAGVSSQVYPYVTMSSNFLERTVLMPSVAIESSCHMPRAHYFDAWHHCCVQEGEFSLQIIFLSGRSTKNFGVNIGTLQLVLLVNITLQPKQQGFNKRPLTIPRTGLNTFGH